MAVFDATYAAAYLASAATVGILAFEVLRRARRTSTSLAPQRLIGLTRDEAARLKTGDAVFLMHLSIALGVALTIGYALLEPVLGYLGPLNILFLVASLPLAAGLVASFGWRIVRFEQSKKVEADLRAEKSFTSASNFLQVILMVAIALTTTELALIWFPSTGLAGFVVGLARNSLIAYYYAEPTVNLVATYDLPLPSVSTPFKLSDVMSGKAEASEVKLGVETVSGFSKSQVLSFDSCVEIGACESACPATAAGRPLSPRVLVRKVALLAEAGAQSGVFPTVGEDELWSCTSCGACVASCPVSVKHLDLIYDLRRELVAKGKVDKEKAAMLENLGQFQNPYGFKNTDRGEWSSGLGVETLATKPEAEYLYWVGCLASFDKRAQKVAAAMAKILKHAGVSFAILGPEEACVGDPARRLGEEGRYQELALQNIEKMNSYKVKKIIATCPHCFNALKNEYPQFGGEYQVVYHTQLISDLIREGKLKVPKEKVQQVSVTLHDACYASRYNSIFDEPRDALRSSVSDLREMGRRKEKTFCCGAGGSNYWFKVPQQKSIAGIRTEEAMKTGAKEIATECPFCLSMFDDSTKVTGSGMGVRDVAEIVAEAL